MYVVGGKDRLKFLDYDAASGGYPYLTVASNAKMFNTFEKARAALVDLKRYNYMETEELKIYKVSFINVDK